MPKRVAVIDLGSNSARAVIFERTSRLGFFILAEHKIKIRLGEGAYENGGILTKDAIQKSLLAFKKFKTLIGTYKVKRVLCIGTSALRDAPNGTGFIKLVRKQTGIAIRKIDGQTEAYLGAYAAQNLLSDFSQGVTLDIGGGSTELALIKNGKIEKTLSLNLGTVRLKELFFDRGDAKGLEKYVSSAVARIGEEFCTQNLIVMGGSARALSGAVMSLQNHPLKIVHNFSYDYEKYVPFFAKLMNAKTLDLAKFPIKKDRYDTIREGAIVFDKIVKRLGAKKVITCGAGVREGAFLNSILRGARLPKSFNPSLRSLLDRFAPEPSSAPRFAKALFYALSPLHGLSEKYIKILQIAASLCEIGRAIGFYAKHETSADMVLGGLNYRTTHKEKALIAAIISMHGRRELGATFAPLSAILPDAAKLAWLSYILELARLLSENALKNLEFSFENSTLKISGADNLIMLKGSLKKLAKPAVFAVNFTS